MSATHLKQVRFVFGLIKSEPTEELMKILSNQNRFEITKRLLMRQGYL